MFITRFVTTSKEIQDYYYHNIEHAKYHLNLFLNDDSGLYENICIVDDEKNVVVESLPFINGIPQQLIFKGDK